MKVAVILCYLGRNESWFRQAINSVTSQHHSVDIFVYINNAKISIPEDLKQKINIVGQSDNLGPGQGANNCLLELIRQSNIKQYDYIMRMDDDDLITEDKIDKQVLFLQNNPDIDFCGTLALIIDENNRIVQANWDYALDNGEDIIKKFLSGGCHIVHASCMFRGKMLYDFGHLWYNPLYIAGEDYDLWFKLFRLGYKYKLLADRLYLYRCHSLQIGKNAKQSLRLKMCENLRKFYVENWEAFC